MKDWLGRSKAEDSKNKWLRKQYGIDIETYEAMLLIQKGKCAICGKVQKYLKKHE